MSGTRVPWLPKRDADGHIFDPADPRHGTVNAYNNLRCRCALCRDAWRREHYRYMHADTRRLDAHAARMRKRRY